MNVEWLQKKPLWRRLFPVAFHGLPKLVRGDITRKPQSRHRAAAPARRPPRTRQRPQRGAASPGRGPRLPASESVAPPAQKGPRFRANPPTRSDPAAPGFSGNRASLEFPRGREARGSRGGAAQAGRGAGFLRIRSAARRRHSCFCGGLRTGRGRHQHRSARRLRGPGPLCSHTDPLPTPPHGSGFHRGNATEGSRAPSGGQLDNRAF